MSDDKERPTIPLRDWFAGMALQGVQQMCLTHAQVVHAGPVLSTEQMAHSAYELADAMLNERTKGK